MEQSGLKIEQVKPESIALELGLEPGDRVIDINGHTLQDVIDFRFFEADESLTILVQKQSGDKWELDVEKDFDESLGIDFGQGGFGHTRGCANRCLFCFVDQMPPGMRPTLYVKDDDYRLSFWTGNFITLTNLSHNDLHRIAQQRLSPLYISVHTTNPALRERMLGNKRAGMISDQLKYLAKAGIEMHTQVVLCPGLNDEQELERTINDLAGLWPAVSSMAIVPVGLTRFRQGLYPLRPFTRDEETRLVHWVGEKQDEFLTRLGNPFVFASDEFYLSSGQKIPSVERYAGFPQLENGVGLTRLFWDEWEAVMTSLPREAPGLKVTLATGRLGEQVLKPVVDRLNAIKGLEVAIKRVDNRFFGEEITVAGLITGEDLLVQLCPDEIGDLLVIPAVMLKRDSDIFLDGMTLTELREQMKVPVAVAGGPRQLVDVLNSSFSARQDKFVHQ
ncbi:MAG: Radical SAM superfamily protein [Pelotomaculum sp. PtaB.Bin104]|nr:MAG: Radical SAM superfamily protein [Pelotomaculum sp. PtaB.Bin104]